MGMTTPLITRLEEAADMKCPKCNARSGDDWEQCKGSCPMPGSPYFESQPQGQAMTDIVRVPREPNPALLPVIASIVRRLAIPTNIDPDEVYFDNGHARQIYAAIVAASPQGEGSSADPAPIKPSGDTRELRERVARKVCCIVRTWQGFKGAPKYTLDMEVENAWDDWLTEADAILDLIQSERAGSPIGQNDQLGLAFSGEGVKP